MPRRLPLGLLLLGLCSCEAFGTVDPGDNPAVRTANLDYEFFACRIQPEVLSAKGCATGTADESGSCHSDQSSFRLRDVDPAYASECRNGIPEGLSGSTEDDVRANFDASEPWVFEDVESSPLLTRPTGVRSHPREIFGTDSAEADLIREWTSIDR